jgi:ATP-binding cassette subfamily B protein
VFTQNSVDLKALTWPISMLGQAIELLAQRSGLVQRPTSLPVSPAGLDQADSELIEQWVEVVASQLEIEAELIVSSYAEMEQLLYRAGPAILQLPASFAAGELRFLALLKGNKRGIFLVGPDASLHRVRPDVIRSALCHELETPVVRRADRILAEIGVSKRRRERTWPAIAQKEIGTTQTSVGWLLRLPPHASLWTLARRASLLRWTLVMTGVYFVQQFLTLGAWAVIGRATFTDHFDWTWLWAWALLHFTTIPFGALASSIESPLANNLRRIFKWQLLYGILRLNPDDVCHQGAGQFMGRVLESRWLENMAVNNGIRTLLIGVTLAMANVPLSAGAGGWPHVALLWGWVGVVILLTWLYYRRFRATINTYRDITNDLVEQMVGHRTRLAQQDSAHWHDEEDRILARYLELSRQTNRAQAMLYGLPPHGWMVLGLLGIAYVFVVSPGPNSQVQLTLSVGGMLLAFQALTTLVRGVWAVAMAMSVRSQVEPLIQAATRPSEDQAAALALLSRPKHEHPARKRPVLTIRGIDFRYRSRAQLVLEKCSLQIREGDRWLLEGPSGGGKSTLASLLAGMRTPQSGLILLWGFDRRAMSTDMWRRRVAMAPQFHENHVLTETLAFNLLMGRRWPPLPEDLAEAETVCRELGLGELLDRMPDGLLQIVGEGGWRLSHGERSRLYIARTILQKADLVILDESFGALDPESLQRTLRCVLDRSPTLLVIAHP